jgi:glycosyltransferase involved in cell wall biosynthesis
MALGKPVIGSAIGAIPEMVINNHTGLLFEPGNYIQLAGLINALYINTEQIHQMGKNAKQHINNLINTQKHFEGLQKLIPAL